MSPGAAVLCVTTHLVFCSLEICLCLGIQGAQDHRESETLRQHGYFWHWFRPLKCKLFSFCFGSESLALGRPDADSSSSVQLHLKLMDKVGTPNRWLMSSICEHCQAGADTRALSDAPVSEGSSTYLHVRTGFSYHVLVGGF